MNLSHFVYLFVFCRNSIHKPAADNIMNTSHKHTHLVFCFKQLFTLIYMYVFTLLIHSVFSLFVLLYWTGKSCMDLSHNQQQMRMKIQCYFYISDYMAGNMCVRRSASSSWCAGSSNSNKNEEVSVVLERGIGKEKHKIISLC